MIAVRPRPKDFALAKDFEPDVDNKGFTDEEIEIVETAVAGGGARGLWPIGRDVPPDLRGLKSEFGFQSQPLLINLVDVAEAQGTPLDAKIKAMLGKHNFYILQCGVYILPDGGEKFEALKFEVAYKGKDVATFSMLPGPLTETRFKVGTKLDVGVNGSMGFALPEVTIQSAKASLDAKAKLESSFIYAFDYELKTPLVDSYGVGTQFCRWLMHQGDRLRNDILFYPIIITPKAAQSFDCEFKASFKIGHSSWKNSELFVKPSRKVTLSA
jgi:hypothetical protein